MLQLEFALVDNAARRQVLLPRKRRSEQLSRVSQQQGCRSGGLAQMQRQRRVEVPDQRVRLPVTPFSHPHIVHSGVIDLRQCANQQRVLGMEGKHGGNQLLPREQHAHALLLLHQHGGEQPHAIGRGADARRVVQKEPRVVQLDRRNAHRGGGKRGNGEVGNCRVSGCGIGGRSWREIFRGIPVVDVEVVVGDHGLLVQLHALRGEGKEVLDGDAIVRSGDALVQEGGLAR